MSGPRLPIFSGGGLGKIIDRGSDSRRRFRVEWANASEETRRTIEEFWKSVGGPAHTWPLDHFGTTYTSCNFEPDSLRIEPTHVAGTYRITVTFRASHCLICSSESALLFDRDISADLVSIDCPDCGNFRIVATMEPGEFEAERKSLQAMIKALQPERTTIRSDWKVRLTHWNKPKPNY